MDLTSFSSFFFGELSSVSVVFEMFFPPHLPLFAIPESKNQNLIAVFAIPLSWLASSQLATL
jgi:hypothetical protein